MTRIVHTTDLSRDDRVPFMHSVALARSAGAELIALHANAPASASAEISSAADVLARWGEPSSAVRFSKRVHDCCDDPVETILDALGELQPDLVVAHTHRRSSLERFFRGSAAEAIAHNATAPTLLFPAEPRSFIALDSGAIDVRRLLVPIGDAQEMGVAIRAAAWFADLASAPEVVFTLLHLGAAGDIDLAPLSSRPGWSTRVEQLPDGSVDETIVAYGREASAIVMATRGHDSVGDVVLGSHTDRVLHESQAPILSVGVR